MGASVTKTSVDIVNESIIEAITENVNNCSTNLEQTQNVNLGGIGFFTSIFQSASLNVSCLQNINITNQLATDIAQKIQQNAAANAIALLPSFSGSENLTNLQNYIKTKVSNNIVQSCAASAVQNQTVNASGFQVGAQVSQTLSLFSKCMQTSLNNNNISQGLVQDIEQKATSTVSNPLDALTGLFTTPVLIFIAILFLIVVIVIIAKYTLSGSNSGSNLSSDSGQISGQHELYVVEPITDL